MYSVRDSVQSFASPTKKHFRNTKPSLSLALHRSGGHEIFLIMYELEDGKCFGLMLQPSQTSDGPKTYLFCIVRT